MGAECSQDLDLKAKVTRLSSTQLASISQGERFLPTSLLQEKGLILVDP